MTQKPVFVEGLFTLRNLRSAGTAAVIEVALALAVTGILIWQQLQPPPALPPRISDPVVDFHKQLPPLQRSDPVPQPPQHQDLSQVPPIPTDIPDQRTLPVQAPPPPQVGEQQSQPPEGLASEFAAGMLRAINDQKVYPRVSMLHGDEGEAVVSFDYMGGVVSNVHVDRSSGFHELDEAAVQAVQKAVLPPKPVELAGLSHFVFHLSFSMGN